MQVFMPHGMTRMSMEALDDRRLCKQRVECLQIINALQGKSKGWRNHPATLMFHGAETAVMYMHDFAIAEWVKRGFKNNMNYMISGDMNYSSVPNPARPEWARVNEYGDRHEKAGQVYLSHKFNLIRKNPEYYWDRFRGNSDLRIALMKASGEMMVNTTQQHAVRLAEDYPYCWPVTKDDILIKEALRYCP